MPLYNKQHLSNEAQFIKNVSNTEADLKTFKTVYLYLKPFPQVPYLFWFWVYLQLH